MEPGENRLCGSVCKSLRIIIATVKCPLLHTLNILQGKVNFDNDGSRVVGVVDIFQYRLINNESSVISRVYFGFTQNINDSQADFFYKSGESNITVFPSKSSQQFRPVFICRKIKIPLYTQMMGSVYNSATIVLI